MEKDDRQAVSWYRKAAEQGDARAQTNLSNLYYTGKGVPKDLQSAYLWSLLASAQGYDPAIVLRGIFETKLAPHEVASVEAKARDWKPRAVAANQQHYARDRLMPKPGFRLSIQQTEGTFR